MVMEEYFSLLVSFSHARNSQFQWCLLEFCCFHPIEKLSINLLDEGMILDVHTYKSANILKSVFSPNRHLRSTGAGLEGGHT